MKCPKCTKEIPFVRVYSECWQAGYLEGNKIKEYAPVEQGHVLPDISGIECPECGEDISKVIEK